MRVRGMALHRSRGNRVIAGGVPGMLLYLILWFIVPGEKDKTS